MKNITIITGTSRGLGHALAKELVEAKHEVFCIQRTLGEEKIENAHYFQCDLSDSEELPKTMAAIFDSIDFENLESICLINNAGVLSPIKSIQNAPLEEIATCIDVNLKALVILCSLFLKKTQHMDLKKTIINISSGAATHPYDGWSVYCATKAAVDLFTGCIGLEQTRQKFPAIVFSFYPGIIDTGMQALIRNSNQEDFPRLQDFIRYKEKGELFSAELVAKTLLNFASTEKAENGGVYDVEKML